MSGHRTAVWRRLDTPGRDTCRIETRDTGSLIAGTAVFLHDGDEAQLSYRVECGPDWVTRSAAVQGTVGARTVEVAIDRDPHGAWRQNGVVIPGLDACLHADFGFTPATNFPQLRHVALIGQTQAEVPVAWLDVPAAPLLLLVQRYERRHDLAYWYEAPRFGYTGLLELTPTGFIRVYPGLWELEHESSSSSSWSSA